MKNVKLNKLLFLLFILYGSFAYSQEKQITGKVIDEMGQPILGASIIVKGTTVGTTTNFDGMYAIEVSSNTDILRFSYVGFRTMEIVVGDQTTINVTLVEDAARPN